MVAATRTTAAKTKTTKKPTAFTPTSAFRHTAPGRTTQRMAPEKNSDDGWGEVLVQSAGVGGGLRAMKLLCMMFGWWTRGHLGMRDGYIVVVVVWRLNVHW